VCVVLCYFSHAQHPTRVTRKPGTDAYLELFQPTSIALYRAREDEHLLVTAAKAGDAAAFEELVNRYERKIFRLTMNITRNRERRGRRDARTHL